MLRFPSPRLSVSAIGKTETNLVSLPLPFFANYRKPTKPADSQGGGRRSIGYTAWVHCVCVYCVCVLGYVLCCAVLFTRLARFILYCRSALVQGFCQIKANKGRAFCFPADDATSLNRYLSHSVSVAVRLSVGLSVCALQLKALQRVWGDIDRET